MKYRTEIIILALVSSLGLYVIIVEADNYFNGQLYDTPQINNDDRKSIQGFTISDEFGNTKQYTIEQLDDIPCEDYMPLWNPEFIKLKESDLLNEKMAICVEQNGGYSTTIEKTRSAPVIFD